MLGISFGSSHLHHPSSLVVRDMSSRATLTLVPEMNRGQILRQVQRVTPAARGLSKTNGEVFTASEIWEAIRKEQV